MKIKIEKYEKKNMTEKKNSIEKKNPRKKKVNFKYLIT